MMIPNILDNIRFKTLTKSQKMVYIALYMRANEEGICFPSQSKIADDTGLDLSTVKRALPVLHELGLAVKRHFGKAQGDSSEYLIEFLKTERRTGGMVPKVNDVAGGTMNSVHHEPSVKSLSELVANTPKLVANTGELVANTPTNIIHEEIKEEIKIKKEEEEREEKREEKEGIISSLDPGVLNWVNSLTQEKIKFLSEEEVTLLINPEFNSLIPQSLKFPLSARIKTLKREKEEKELNSLKEKEKKIINEINRAKETLREEFLSSIVPVMVSRFGRDKVSLVEDYDLRGFRFSIEGNKCTVSYPNGGSTMYFEKRNEDFNSLNKGNNATKEKKDLLKGIDPPCGWVSPEVKSLEEKRKEDLEFLLANPPRGLVA